MARRQRWRYGVAGLMAYVLVGCLYQGSLRPTGPPGPNESKVAAAAEPSPDPDGPPPPPPPPPPPGAPPAGASDYHAWAPTPSTQLRTAESREPDPPALVKDSPPPPAPPGEKPTPDAPAILPPTVLAGPAVPATLDPPLPTSLRSALAKHPQEAQLLLQKCEKADRALLVALVKLASAGGEGELEKLPPEELNATLEHLNAVTQQLRKRAALALDNVCFCRRIEGFGQYEPMPAGHEFQAGGAGCAGERVQVYAEVRNFTTRLRDGQYETVLDSSLEIHDAQRRPVVKMNLGKCTDCSQSPRQDYFLNFQLHVPPKLPPGLYTLWVTVKDVTPGGGSAGARVARRSLDFKVRPGGPAATTSVSAESPR